MSLKLNTSENKEQEPTVEINDIELIENQNDSENETENEEDKHLYQKCFYNVF